MYTWHDANYNKRIKLTIDGSKIEEDLYNFPIMIHLSDSSGITNTDVTDVFDELLEDYIILEDTFSGTSLNTSKWNTHITPNASITVSGALELNNETGDAHSGAQCDSKINIPKRGIIELGCKWKPHKNHYSSAALPAIIFYKSDIVARDSYYGYINDKTLHLQLGAGGNTTDRTSLTLYYVDSGSFTSLGTVGIDIDETQWHDIYWKIDCENQTSIVKLDDTYTINATITDTQINSLGDYLKLELSTSDYNKDNTERFKDVTITVPKDNSKKLSLYTATSGTDTQCYMEVDYWPTSSGFKNATVWAKIPTIYSGINTDLYLYYSKNVPDNTYVGLTTEFAAKQVWDDNFLAVYHLNSTHNVYDSTSNLRHGTLNGFSNGNIETSITSKALEFDGSNNYVSIPESMIDNQTELTIEILCNFDVSASKALLSDGVHWWDDVSLNVNTDSSSNFAFDVAQSSSVYTRLTKSSIVVINTDKIYTMAFKANNYLKIFTDGYLSISGSTNVAFVKNEDNTLCIGRRNYGGGDQYFDGTIDEVRLSSIARSNSWVKASAYSLLDNLITYSEKEIKPSFIFNGYVKVGGAPVSRTVYFYRRSTGEFIGYAISDPSSGYFEIATPYDDYHFVAVLPELSETYNILVKDKIKYGT